MTHEDQALHSATRELIEASLLLAAYAESMAKLGHGSKDTSLRMALEVNRVAENARVALREATKDLNTSSDRFAAGLSDVETQLPQSQGESELRAE
jgi:hypothetical protein